MSEKDSIIYARLKSGESSTLIFAALARLRRPWETPT
jgi:hypothetical protein